MDSLFHPAFYPFVIAGILVLVLVGIEAGALLLGLSSWQVLDYDVGHPDIRGGEAGFLSAAFDWLNVGRVPLMALLVLILAAFSIIGFLIQSAGFSLGFFFPTWPASLGAGLLSIPVARRGSRWLTKIVPRDETYAVVDQDFIGRMAIVTVGPVRGDGVARRGEHALARGEVLAGTRVGRGDGVEVEIPRLAPQRLHLLLLRAVADDHRDRGVRDQFDGSGIGRHGHVSSPCSWRHPNG